MIALPSVTCFWARRARPSGAASTSTSQRKTAAALGALSVEPGRVSKEKQNERKGVWQWPAQVKWKVELAAGDGQGG
eukprot:CAMPEP_0194558744 /NCGR_PEP_ID=MMETSP0292-20121207/547_1 /TAXON_ID=39354 /ORGANISM="Heterosigma akashiwo, Strain CCMP2393" /LENGTH=76 /DNA_ID=CAMNT_0039406475 /DNA_START=437 /DNA_END=665 /DNA_ORIENTATION=-